MYFINLNLIDPNPWQPRQVFEVPAIAELAADILSRADGRPNSKGLLQIPTVRIVDKKGNLIVDRDYTDPATQTIEALFEAAPGAVLSDYRAQLAFGHRRFAAFQILVKENPDDYSAMPVEVAWFSDEEMATAAWSENSARKNLTAIEEARAIRQMMKSFKWKQKEAAEKLNMNRATLANRLRLLKLPKSIQDEVMQGNLSERKGLALLPIYELSKPLRDKAEERSWNSPTMIVEEALSGNNDSDQIREDIKYMLGGITSDLSAAKFPLDHEFKTLKVIVSPACDNCKSRIRRGQTMLCPVGDCYQKKGELWGRILLRKASKEFSIPILKESEDEWGENETFDSYQEPKAKAGKLILEETCEKGNLRLKYWPWGGSGALKLGKGYKGISVVCHRGEGKQCTCLQRHMPAAKAEDQGISVEDYTEAREAAKERKRRVEEEIRAPAVEGLAILLDEGSVDVWRMMADLLVEQVGRQMDPGKLKDLHAVQDYISAAMIEYAMPWAPEDNLEETAREVSAYLEAGAKLKIDGLQPENFKEPEAEEVEDGEETAEV